MYRLTVVIAEAVEVVGVPEDGAVVAEAAAPELIADRVAGRGGLPLLGEQGHHPSRGRGGADHLGGEDPGQGGGQVGGLLLLTLVDPGGVAAADLLPPAEQPDAVVELVGRPGGIADEDQGGGEPGGRQRPAELAGAHPQPPGEAVLVGSLEADHDHLEVCRGEHGASLRDGPWAGPRPAPALATTPPRRG